MRNLIKSLLGLSLGVFLFSSCSKEVYNPADSDDYFPLQVGKYILYDVDSIYYDAFSLTTFQTTYQMRYEVADSFMDNAGRVNYTINVYERPQTDSAFTARDVIQVAKTSTGLEWTQSNAKLLKMVFPVADGTHWNGVTYIEPRQNGMEEYDIAKFDWDFHYSNVGADFDPGNNPFYKTATVTGIDETTNDPSDPQVTYADRNYYQEIYAAGVGMIYRERIYWVYQENTSNNTYYKQGYELRMRAVEQN